jgi:hypothetical protein
MSDWMIAIIMPFRSLSSPSIRESLRTHHMAWLPVDDHEWTGSCQPDSPAMRRAVQQMRRLPICSFRQAHSHFPIRSIIYVITICLRFENSTYFQVAEIEQEQPSPIRTRTWSLFSSGNRFDSNCFQDWSRMHWWTFDSRTQWRPMQGSGTSRANVLDRLLDDMFNSEKWFSQKLNFFLDNQSLKFYRLPYRVLQKVDDVLKMLELRKLFMRVFTSWWHCQVFYCFTAKSSRLISHFSRLANTRLEQTKAVPRRPPQSDQQLPQTDVKGVDQTCVGANGVARWHNRLFNAGKVTRRPRAGDMQAAKRGGRHSAEVVR